MHYYNLIKEKFNKITEMKYFDEIFVMMMALITLIGWMFNTIISLVLFIIISILTIILSNSLKYSLPSIVYFLFSINDGFSSKKISIPITILVIIFVVVMIIQVIRNGFKLSKFKSWIGLSGLAIVSIIPIFWADNIPKENWVFYLLFFANLAYLLLYFILVNGLKQDSFKLLCIIMSYLGVIVAFQCLYKVIELHDTVENILELVYFLGWGVCNEAAIMMCFSLPFIFYLIGKSFNKAYISLGYLKAFIMLGGVILTTSRAGILFWLLELFVLFVVTYINCENKKNYRFVSNILIGIVLVISVICIMPLINLIKDVITIIFNDGFNIDARVELWNESFTNWIMNPRNIIFGAGITSVLRETPTAGGFQLSMIVFHSTIFETLAVGGILGIIFLLIHFVEKYKAIVITHDKLLCSTLISGFIILDLYGMLDNTYHMYYFMIPMVVFLACIDNLNYKNLSKEESA